MATISGRVIFDRDRSLTVSTGDSGIAGIPVVLQNTATGVPVSYTHLDVYKRQGLYSVSIVTAGEAAFVSSVEIREEGGAL